MTVTSLVCFCVSRSAAAPPTSWTPAVTRRRPPPPHRRRPRTSSKVTRPVGVQHPRLTRPRRDPATTVSTSRVRHPSHFLIQCHIPIFGFQYQIQNDTFFIYCIYTRFKTGLYKKNAQTILFSVFIVLQNQDFLLKLVVFPSFAATSLAQRLNGMMFIFILT